MEFFNTNFITNSQSMNNTSESDRMKLRSNSMSEASKQTGQQTNDTKHGDGGAKEKMQGMTYVSNDDLGSEASSKGGQGKEDWHKITSKAPHLINFINSKVHTFSIDERKVWWLWTYHIKDQNIMFLKKMSEMNKVFKNYTPTKAKKDEGHSGQGYFVETLKHYIPTIEKFIKFRAKQHGKYYEWRVISPYDIKQNYLNLTSEYPKDLHLMKLTTSAILQRMEDKDDYNIKQYFKPTP